MKLIISRGNIFKLLTAVLAITMMFSSVPLRVFASNNVEEATTGDFIIPDIFYGDFTGNGEIDGTDILWMNRYIQCDCDLGAMLQKYPSTITFSEAAADFTNDGVVDENDVLWISKYIAANCDAEAMIQRFSPEIDFSHLTLYSIPIYDDGPKVTPTSILPNTNAPIVFKDLKFKEAIVAALKKPTGSDLYQNDLSGISVLDVSGKGITSMGELSYFKNLSVLDCSNNRLTTLDVSKNSLLTRLICSKNNLYALDVSKNMKLQYLYCDNNSLTLLDMSNNTILRYLYCYSNNLATLDVSNNTSLQHIDCSYNNLSTLDVSNNMQLYLLYCEYNNLTTLDVNNNPSLEYLYCGGSQLETVYFTRGSSACSIEINGNGYLSELSIDFKNGQIQIGALGEIRPDWELSGIMVDSTNYIDFSLTGSGIAYGEVNGTRLVANFTGTPATPLVQLAMVIGYDTYSITQDGNEVTAYLATIIDINGKVRDVPTTQGMYNSSARVGVVSLFAIDNSGRYTFSAPGTDPAYTIDTGITMIEKGATTLYGGSSVTLANSSTKFVLVNYMKDPNDDSNRIPDRTITLYTGRNNVPTIDHLFATTAVSYSEGGTADNIADIVFIFDDVYAAPTFSFVYIVGSWYQTSSGYFVDVIIEGNWDTITVKSAADRNTLIAMAGQLWDNIKVTSTGALDLTSAKQLFYDPSEPLWMRPSAGISIKNNTGFLELDGFFNGYMAEYYVPVYTIIRTDTFEAEVIEGSAEYLDEDGFGFAYLDADSDHVVSAIYIIRYDTRTITSFAAIDVTTHVGSPPSLPTYIEAYYNDGSRSNVLVTWDYIPSSQYASVGTFTVQGTVTGTLIRPSATVTVIAPPPPMPPVQLAMVIGYDYYAEIRDGKIVITYIATIIDIDGKVSDVPTTKMMYDSNSRIGVVSLFFINNSGRYTFTAPGTDLTYNVDYGITKIEKGALDLVGGTSVIIANNATKFVVVNYKTDPDDDNRRIPSGTVTLYTGRNNVPTFDPLSNTTAISHNAYGVADSIADIVFIFDDVYAASESTFVYIVGSWNLTSYGSSYGYAVDAIIDGKWDAITVKSVNDRNILVAMADKLWDNIRVTSTGALDITGAIELFNDTSAPQPRPSAGTSIKNNGGLLELDGIYTGYTADDYVPVYTITRFDTDGAYLVEERIAQYLDENDFSFAYLDANYDRVVSAIYIIKNSVYVERTITSFASIDVYTNVGTAPIMPTQITAYYSDSARGNVSVTWDSIDSSQYASAGTFTVQGTVAGTSVRPSATVTVSPASAAIKLAMVIGYDYYAEIRDGKIVITYIATIIDIDGKVSDVPTTKMMYDSNSRIGVVSLVTTDNSGRCTFFAPAPTDPTYNVDAGIITIEKGSTVLRGGASVNFASNNTKFVIVNFKNDPDDDYYRFPDGTVTVYTGRNNVPTLDPLCNTTAVSYNADGVAGGIADIVFIFDDVFVASELSFVYLVGSWSWTPDGYAVDAIIEGKWDTITVKSASDRDALIAIAGQLWNNIRINSNGWLDLSSAVQLLHVPSTWPQPSAEYTIENNGGLLFLDAVFYGYTADDDVPVYTITRTDADGAYLVEEVTAKYLNEDNFSLAYLDAYSNRVVSAIYIIKNNVYASRTITSFAPANVYTNVGTAPIMPTQITAYYSDGARGNVFVTWDFIDSSQYASVGTFTVQGVVAGTSVRPNATVLVSPAPIPITPIMVIGYDSYTVLQDSKIVTTYIATIVDIDGIVNDVPTTKMMYDLNYRIGVVSVFSIDIYGRYRFTEPALDISYSVDTGITKIEKGATTLYGGTSVYLASNITKFVFINYMKDPYDEYYRVPDGTVTVYTGRNNVPTFDALNHTTAVSYSLDGVADNIADIVFIFDDVYANPEFTYVYIVGSWYMDQYGYNMDVIVKGKWDTITVHSVADRNALLAMAGQLWTNIIVTSNGFLDLTSAKQLLYEVSSPSAASSIKSIGGLLELDGVYSGYTANDDTPVYIITKTGAFEADVIEVPAAYLDEDDFDFAYLDANYNKVISAIYIIKFDM